MSTKPKDGGPAFPSLQTFQQFHEDLGRYVDVTAPAGGMSLRDYFATEASRGAADVLCDVMEPFLSPLATQDWRAQALHLAQQRAALHARAAYIYADAMLRAREGQ